jgi:hypothetical protein
VDATVPSGICIEDPLSRQSESRAQPLRGSNVSDGLDAEGCFGKVDLGAFGGWAWGALRRRDGGGREVEEMRCWIERGDGVNLGVWWQWKRGGACDDAARRESIRHEKATTEAAKGISIIREPSVHQGSAAAVNQTPR